VTHAWVAGADGEDVGDDFHGRGGGCGMILYGFVSASESWCSDWQESRER